jgi:hypothetical protein
MYKQIQRAFRRTDAFTVGDLEMISLAEGKKVNRQIR